MSFNRSFYDEGAYKKDIDQSVGPGVYQTCQPCIQGCYPSPPEIRLQRFGDSLSSTSHLIDVESELLGGSLFRPASRDPSKKYVPNCPGSDCNTGEVCGQGVVGQCRGMRPGQRAPDGDLRHFQDCFIPWENTRLSNPPCTLRGTGWNRWEWLCIDPQERVMVPFDYLIDTHILHKDNHRACIPAPIDPTPLLPRGGTLPCDPIGPACAVPVAPPSVSWQKCSEIKQY
jgi:hypothetical protein